MHIKDAIESVLEQSFVDFEFILIDDGSTDRTSSIIQSYNDKEYVLFRTVIIL
ncbi:glycosyltransferase [Bacteroides fragilis]